MSRARAGERPSHPRLSDAARTAGLVVAAILVILLGVFLLLKAFDYVTDSRGPGDPGGSVHVL